VHNGCIYEFSVNFHGYSRLDANANALPEMENRDPSGVFENAHGLHGIGTVLKQNHVHPSSDIVQEVIWNAPPSQTLSGVADTEIEVPNSVFQTTEPTLPNEVKVKPADPDLMFLFERNIPSKTGINLDNVVLDLDFASDSEVVDGDSDKRKHAERSTDTFAQNNSVALTGKNDLQGGRQIKNPIGGSSPDNGEVLTSCLQQEGSSTNAVAQPELFANQIRARPTHRENLVSNSLNKSSSQVNESKPPKPNDEFWESWMKGWKKQPRRAQFSIFLFILYFAMDIGDFLLSIVYLSSYNPACHALVSPLAAASGSAQNPGAPMTYAHVFFYLAVTATVAASIFLCVTIEQIFAAINRQKEDSWTPDPAVALLHLSRAQWEAMGNSRLNQVKLQEFLKLLLRDSLMTIVIICNLGPHDDGSITYLKLIISTFTLSRTAASLALVFTLHLISHWLTWFSWAVGYHKLQETGTTQSSENFSTFHRTYMYAFLKATFTVVFFVLWLLYPSMVLSSKNVVKLKSPTGNNIGMWARSRSIHITRSQTVNARVLVLCIPPTPDELQKVNGDLSLLANRCDPSKCNQQYSSYERISYYSYNTGRFVTSENAVICSVKNVAISHPSVKYGGVDPATYNLTLPGFPNEAQFHALLPCISPISQLPSTEANPSKSLARIKVSKYWPSHLYLPNVTQPISSVELRRTLTTINPAVYGLTPTLASYFERVGTSPGSWAAQPHQYMANDKVGDQGHCIRRWGVLANAASKLNLEESNYLSSQEWQDSNQNYVFLVEVVQEDLTRGPLQCAFDLVGAVHSSVSVLGGSEGLAAMGRDMGKIINRVFGISHRDADDADVYNV
jgi:hypothetical protein